MSFTAVTTEDISEEYRAELVRVQQTRTLSEEAGEFRSYLVQQGVVEEVVKVLLGLLAADEGARPDNGRAFLNAYFDTKQLDPFVAASPKIDIDQLLELNESLRAEHEQLQSDVRELSDIWTGLQLDKWGPQLRALARAFGGKDGDETTPFDAQALLSAAQTAALAAAAAADLPAPAFKGVPLPQDAPSPEPVECPAKVLHAWAISEFVDVPPGKPGWGPSSLEVFVRAVLPDFFAPDGGAAEGAGDGKGPSGVAHAAGAQPNAAVFAAETEAAAMRAARLLARARAASGKAESEGE
ncbi:hypothetical protein KFE25_002414 [Diacronema lutheri]|uniref:Uncharacterized protein n=2 Tax=Diacronema lutheri TaxID=2081491 RepID=A0A8J6C953_DIALT|nr:hypothetical protein KFE25_002414 [Diacronema lutheri]